jgi:hypothetical protein
LRSARRCIVRSRSCRPIWILGSRNIMRRGPIRDAGASAKPDADLPGCHADDEGENDRSLITSDTKTPPLKPGTDCQIEFRLIHLKGCCGIVTRWTRHCRNRSSVSADSMTLRSLRPLDCSMRMIFCALSICLPSRPGEFHPEPLTEPDVSLSTYPAHAIARRLPPSIDRRVPPVAG